MLAGFGWQRDDVKLVQQMASNGAEPIGSLGYDGPLAALSPERQNLADYFKETVAVVTNPAIDREREIEHFSTRTLFGRRPSLDAAGEDTGTVETAFPVILGGHHGLAPLSDKTYRKIAREHHTYLLEDLWEEFRGRAAAVDISLLESETTTGAIERIKQEAVKKVRDGAELLDPHRPHRLRRRAPLPRPAPGDLGGRPGAEAVPGRARRREPAPPLRPRPALGRDPQRPRRDAGARPRRQRRLPVHDGRGGLRRGLRDRRRQPLRGPDQGDRESDLDDRDPRGPRLRASVLLDRDQARAGGDLPDRGLRGFEPRAAPASPSSTRTPTRAPAPSPATTRPPNRRRRSASTRRSTRRRSRPPTAAAATRSTRRRSATSRSRARSRCATSWP